MFDATFSVLKCCAAASIARATWARTHRARATQELSLAVSSPGRWRCIPRVASDGSSDAAQWDVVQRRTFVTQVATLRSLAQKVA